MVRMRVPAGTCHRRIESSDRPTPNAEATICPLGAKATEVLAIEALAPPAELIVVINCPFAALHNLSVQPLTVASIVLSGEYATSLTVPQPICPATTLKTDAPSDARQRFAALSLSPVNIVCPFGAKATLVALPVG